MENLLVLLDKIQQLSPLPVFAQDTVIVQNAGMQHWLNMSLAEQRGISMNMRYALPSQFLWNLIRNLASDEDVPEQSPYSREVLAWRIDTLLAANEVIDDDAFKVASDYWQADSKNSGNNSYSEAEQLKRYQLACQLADLYEQYLIFRPEWIHAWHQGEFTAFDHQASASSSDTIEEGKQTEASNAIWQGKLWHLLVRDQPYDPRELVALAIKNLNNVDRLKAQALPHRLSFFGINAMAPLWLEFINALSEQIDVHFFHLNPCYAYWGDVVTEKNAIEAWLKGTDFSAGQKTADENNSENDQQLGLFTDVESNDFESKDLADINQQVGNPLLANLGQQGREFMALLYQYSTINIDVFESAVADLASENSKSADQANPSAEAIAQASVLASVQQDILSLTDARSPKSTKTLQSPKVDGSILITSAHSALREVQGLHDWLLHQFNQDKSLTPKDVLVMCPQVEQYAPYVNAVFTRGWQDIADEVPPLPCSIADRISKDAEPLVAAFAQLLTLPDSRFQVSSLIALLRLPAMQARFGINLDDIEKITHWLEVSCVHWGLDKAHKQQVLAQSEAQETETLSGTSDSFTWQQGFSRLMRGFAFADHSVIYQNQMLLPTIEGSDSELLGKLMLIIEQLQLTAINMSKARTASQWQQFLFDLLQQLFDDENDNGLNVVRSAVESLVEYCQHAAYTSDISLAVIRDFLNSHFSQPDPGRQFMIGQVTFCSMLPMRSIPFKIIAVLGLNDGEFPRQRQPLSFDLMTTTPAQLGDRSRRGDDRYLFLEAIISARQALYLSYQGKNIRNNKDRQPSLVLKELMEYLARGYGWQLLGLNAETETGAQTNTLSQVRQLPMQAFSEKNYLGRFGSFDANWLNLRRTKVTDSSVHNQTENSNSQTIDNSMAIIDDSLSVTDVIRFYQHPSRYYGQHTLYLYLDNSHTVINDVEPFVPNHLDSYLLRQELLNYYLAPAQSKQSCDDILLSAKLSGNLPDLPNTDELIKGWQKDSEDFSQFIIAELTQNDALTIAPIDCSVTLDLANILTNQTLLANGLYSKSDLEILKTVLPQHLTLNCKLTIVDNKALFYRSSSAKAKDLFTLYLHQLIIQIAQADEAQENADIFANISATHGYYFDTKSQKPSQFYFSDIEDAKGLLLGLIVTFYLGQHQPLLLNGDIGEKIRKSKVFEQAQFEQFWSDSNSFQAFGDDAYVQYFWPQCPDYEEISPRLLTLYQPMFDALQTVKQGANK
ncbi:exodeoxyribonuclease V subunit gamma [Cognaticolwellia beringensis]|uniref:RecBCD enzyme subunit RecC n=2 Tax=Cognaticolwellia beringensis TaxID=1967665 RepID=A0A222GAZ7_9GAMM|nr:exodeoxyribonuclease V subunit gamma [Cognaticolwellia beringensis]